MTTKQLIAARKLAANGIGVDEQNIDLFVGFALPDFQPVYCTLAQVAHLIVWQCHEFGGGFDDNAFQTIATFRRRFIIVG